MGAARRARPDAFYRFTLGARSTVIISVSDADMPATSTFYLTLRVLPSRFRAFTASRMA